MRKIAFILLVVLALPVSGGWHWQQKPMLGQQIDYSNPLADGLVGCWLMNEGTGKCMNLATALDGGRHHGTLTGTAPSWQPCRNGPGVYLPGTDEHLDLNSAIGADFNITNDTDYTIVAGIYCTDAVARYYRNAIVSSDEGRNCVFKLYPWDDPDYQNHMMLNLKHDDTDVYSNSYIMENTWYDVAATYRGSDHSAILYINGVADNSGALDDEYSHPTNALYIGREARNLQYWHGYIDYVYIYARTLSSSEISLLYREPFCYIKEPFDYKLYGAIGEAPAPTGAQVIIIQMSLLFLIAVPVYYFRKKWY